MSRPDSSILWKCDPRTPFWKNRTVSFVIRGYPEKLSRTKGRPQASPRYLNILTSLSFFDNVLLFQGHRGWMPRRAWTISLFGERFFRQKIGKVFRPVHIKWRTIRPYAFLLHTPPVSFPKTTGLFGGIGDIHDFHQRTLFYFNRLDKNQAYNNRRNYHIII